MGTSENQSDATRADIAERICLGAWIEGQSLPDLDENELGCPIRQRIGKAIRRALRDDILQVDDSASGVTRKQIGDDNAGVILDRLGCTPEHREEITACRNSAAGRTRKQIDAACAEIGIAAVRRAMLLQTEELVRLIRDPGASTSAIIEAFNPPSCRRSPQIVDLSDLRRENPPLRDPVIERLIRESEVGNIISSTKAGKSWLVSALCLCIASGRDFLGLPVYRGKVLLIDNELHRETLWSRIQAVSKAMGLRPADYESNFKVWTQRGNWRDLNSTLEVLCHLRSERFRLVVIDALYRTMPVGISENDNAAICQLYNTLDQIAATLDSAVVVVHHATKGDQSGKGVTDVGSGAGSQSRAVDAHIVLRPHAEENCAVMEAALRSFPPFDPLPIRWNFPIWTPANDLDPRALKTPETRQQREQAQRDIEAAENIITTIKQIGQMSRYGVAQHTGYGKERVNRMVSKLIDDGLLTITSIPGSGGRMLELLNLTRTDGPDCQSGAGSPGVGLVP